MDTLHPLRTLISERKISRRVTEYKNGKRVTKTYVARGPVAAISTTTKDHLAIDDENRHASIFVDQSSEQTRRIAKSYTQRSVGLTRGDLRIWRTVHRLLEKKIGTKVAFPGWFEEVANALPDDLRVRRYYPSFIEACRTVCLIRSFQRHPRRNQDGELEVEFADFAIAALIFDPVFVESLHLRKGTAEETRRLVDTLSREKGRPVRARDIARKLGISLDKTYAKLRYAEQAGAIGRANGPEKGNRKLFLAERRPRFVPDPEALFQDLKCVKSPVRFFHPITGKLVVYRRAE